MVHMGTAAHGFRPRVNRRRVCVTASVHIMCVQRMFVDAFLIARNAGLESGLLISISTGIFPVHHPSKPTKSLEGREIIGERELDVRL